MNFLKNRIKFFFEISSLLIKQTPNNCQHLLELYVRAGCPAFARSYVGVHRSTLLMSGSGLSNLDSFRDGR